MTIQQGIKKVLLEKGLVSVDDVHDRLRLVGFEYDSNGMPCGEFTVKSDGDCYLFSQTVEEVAH